jgi:cytochrome c-type biogenesis protein CcmH
MINALRKHRAASARLLAPLLFAAVLLLAPASQAQQTERAKELGKKLMCVCGCNQILTACNHVGCTYSHTMLKELDRAVARNESDELILQGFVQEYGPTVLAEPPAKGFDWAAWIVPVVVPAHSLGGGATLAPARASRACRRPTNFARIARPRAARSRQGNR